MTDSIYKAPDIRTQKLEEAEERLAEKRVARLIMAQKYGQTQLEKALKIKNKKTEQFSKAITLFDRAMIKLQEDIEKLQSRLDKISDIHSEIVNVEGIINEQS